MGCVALSSYITPAEIDQDAVNYVAGVVAAPSDYSGYSNMTKAEQLRKDVNATHLIIQQDLQHEMQKDDLEHSIHQEVTTSNYTVAQQREEMLFGETGLLSLGLSMAGFGSLTGLLGLSRKRPGDVTAPEMEQAVATATGKTTAELSVKEKQFVQLVKGVQAFMTTNQGTLADKELKTAMNEAQDKDTQAAVAVVKKIA